MFDKVLIANRGEIAVRVARGLREMGITSVAVFSEADRGGLHVQLADEAWPIGPAPSNQSYLVMDKVLEVATKSGAQAIHPGFGFLSENADFARAVTDAGLVWIGPPPAAIAAMGSKTVARERMIAAGVPVVPGSEPLADPRQALGYAQSIGFPVLVKAAAGGGGKGMRRVDEASDFVAAFEGARREALAAFGDGTVYVEKFVVRPKHVEFQLLSDQHGRHLHLFERDCSVQRRHQKVIEETPCPVLRDDVRQAMGEVAVRAAEAVDYVGAGTVEFLLDEDQNFYFLEMNTRLQVEHPITEMCTGIDLVHWQLRIAAGQPLTLTQEDIQPRGAAIECRIYAEAPERNFMPSPGVITKLRVPAGPGIRDDSGVYEGAEVPVYYDPMISKLVVWAADRTMAIGRMRRALSEYVVLGIDNNIRFHQAVLADDDFITGTYDTQFVTRRQDELVAQCALTSQELDDAAVTAAITAVTRKSNGAASTANSTSKYDGLSPWTLKHRLERMR